MNRFFTCGMCSIGFAVALSGFASAQITFPLQGVGNDHRADTTYDDEGNLYVSGLFNQPIDFNPGPESITLSATNGESAFLASYNSQGLFRWVREIAPDERTFAFNEDNADLAVYDDGWQNTDVTPGFSNWFVITELGWSGQRELNTTSPLENSRSWQIAASNTFYGVGRAFLSPFTDGRISVLIRHDLQPNGNFVGFNLHGSLSSSGFGGTLERVSFGLLQTNRIGVTVDMIGPDFYLEPTLDGDLRGDLLEYIIDMRATSNWTIRIINHSEAGTPTVTTNVILQSINPTVRSIRFGSFISGTNNILAFDRIRVATGRVDSVIDLTGISFVQPSNVWIHGGLDGSLLASDLFTNVPLSAIGGTNGFAIAYDLSGNISDSFLVTSTSAPGNSVVAGIARTLTNNLHVHGHFSGSLNFRDLVITSGVHQLLWRALLTPSSDLVNFRRYAGIGTHQASGHYRFDSGHLILLGSFTDTGILGLASAGGSDLMMINAEAGAFQFGGPGDDAPCQNGLISDGTTLFFGGNFQQTIPFMLDDEEKSISATGFSDMFIASTDGSIMHWARSFGGGETNRLTALTLDHQTNLIAAGTFRGTMEMDGIDGNVVLTSTANGENALDAFIASYDRHGTFRWAYRIGSTENHGGSIIAASAATDAQGRTVVALEFTTEVLHEQPGSFLAITNAGRSDVLLLQIESDGSLSGPALSLDHVDSSSTDLSIATRAGVNLRVEAGTPDTSWSVITNIAVTTGTVSITTSDTNAMFRAVTEW